MLFAIVFPEVISSIGAEQWKGAPQCVEDFYRLGAPRPDDATSLFRKYGRLYVSFL
jgi:hypothetical protein